MPGRLVVLLVVVLAGCPSETPPVVASSPVDAGAKAVEAAKPVVAKPLPVRPRGIASIGGKVVDALGSLVEAEVVLARRDEKPAVARERSACEPTGLEVALDVVRERVTHERLETLKPDERGRFVFKSLAPGAYVVWAETPTHRSASYPVDVAYLHSELGLVAVVPKRSLDVTLQTTLGEAGRGLSAIVYDGSGRLATANANADGKLSFPSLPLTGLGLVVQGPAVSPTQVDVPDGLSSMEAKAIANAARTVRVRDDGKSVAGATVSARGPRLGACEVTTDAQGDAVFPALPLDGTFVEVTSGSRAGAADLGPGPTATISLGDASRFTLSVVDEKKAPVAGARVAVFGAPGPARVVTTGADGVATFTGLVRAAGGTLDGAAGADGHSAETFSVAWKAGALASTVRLRIARAVECRVAVSPEGTMPEGRVVLRAAGKKPGPEVLPMSLDGRTAWRDEVPSGEWTCGFEDEVDGKLIASRPFKHPLTDDGSFVTLDVR